MSTTYLKHISYLTNLFKAGGDLAAILQAVVDSVHDGLKRNLCLRIDPSSTFSELALYPTSAKPIECSPPSDTTPLKLPLSYQDQVFGKLVVQVNRRSPLSSEEQQFAQIVVDQCSTFMYQEYLQQKAQLEQKPSTLGDRPQPALNFTHHHDPLQFFLEHVPAAVAILDRELRYLFTSRCWLKLIRTEHKSLIGRFHYDVCPDLPDHWRQGHQRCLTGAVEASEEECISLPDGTVQWQRWEVRPWYQEAETIGGIIIFVEDITNRKQTELALQKSELRLRLAVEAAQMGVWDYDMLTGAEVWSPRSEAILGFAPGTFDGDTETLLARVHPEDQDRVRNSHDYVNEDGIVQYEFRVFYPDNTLHWVASRGKVFYDETGAPVRMVGVDLDITSQKQTETELRTSLEEKTALIQEVHHRVKNNLQIISSLLQLQSGSIKDPDTLQLLKESQNRVYTMALVHEQLYQSRNLAHINAADYMTRLITGLFRSYVAHRHQIQVQLAIEPINLDPDIAIPCGLIINELITNSIKYAFPEQQAGIVSVQFAIAPCGHYQLTVGDNGVGFAPEVDPFQLESLGMRLVTSLTRQLGGTITLDRSKGTHFIITFANYPDERI